MAQSTMYKRHRIFPEIIQATVCYTIESTWIAAKSKDLMAQRGITVSYEAIRLWCNKFGSKYVQRLRRERQGYGDIFFID
jgi:putative transposase